jgi:hypothetical protein
MSGAVDVGGDKMWLSSANGKLPSVHDGLAGNGRKASRHFDPSAQGWCLHLVQARDLTNIDQKARAACIDETGVSAQDVENSKV